MNSQELWRGFYGDSWPIAHLLRQSHPDLWLRFHSLPNSQRYARNQAQTGEILRRAKLASSEILELGAPSVLFFPRYAERDFAGLSSQFFGRYSGDELEIFLHCATVNFPPPSWERVLRRVADDQIRFVLFLNSESGEIFAPYDGGMDLFLRSPQKRAALREKFSDWLSSHPQGL